MQGELKLGGRLPEGLSFDEGLNPGRSTLLLGANSSHITLLNCYSGFPVAAALPFTKS